MVTTFGAAPLLQLFDAMLHNFGDRMPPETRNHLKQEYNAFATINAFRRNLVHGLITTPTDGRLDLRIPPNRGRKWNDDVGPQLTEMTNRALDLAQNAFHLTAPAK